MTYALILASYNDIIAYFILETWHFVCLSLPDVLTLTTMILVFLKIAALDSYDNDSSFSENCSFGQL